MLYHISYVVTVRGPLISNRHSFSAEYKEFKNPPTRNDIEEMKKRIALTRIASSVDVEILGVNQLAGK